MASLPTLDHKCFAPGVIKVSVGSVGITFRVRRTLLMGLTMGSLSTMGLKGRLCKSRFEGKSGGIWVSGKAPLETIWK
jgi:hypothetical protein